MNLSISNLRLLVPKLVTLITLLAVAASPWLEPLSPEHPQSTRALCVILLMAWLWVSERVPLFVTALLPLVLFPTLDLGGLKVLSQAYGNSIIFLFLSGFLLALALERWAVHERVAIGVLARFKGGASQFVGVILGMTAFLSMWISNTAAAILMLPIAASSLRLFEAHGGERPLFSKALYLSIAFGASIGGIGTIVGSPPNALLASFIAGTGQPKLTFLDYLMVGLPLLIVLIPLAWLLLTRTFGRLEAIDGKLTQMHFKAELSSLPKLSPAQKRVAAVFVGVASLWVLGPLLPFRLDDASIGIGGAVVLFFLSSGEAAKSPQASSERCLDLWVIPRIPWDVLILFGGGIAVSETFQSSGLSTLLGQTVHAWGSPPFWVVITVLVGAIILLTELASNTAVAAAFLPVAVSLAAATGHPPLALGFPVAMAASLSFMLPVATPPNALVYASGKVSAQDMIKIGWRMNLLSAVAIILFSLLVLT